MLAIGIDVGSTTTKVVGVRLGDGHATTEMILTRPTATTGRQLRADVLAMLDAVVASVGPVAAVGIASMAETGLVIDAAGEPLMPLLRWQDVTGPRVDTGPLDALIAEVGREQLFAATGVRLSAKVPLVVWRTLGIERPGLLRGARWAGMADWIHLVVTGELATDHTLAGRTGGFRLDGCWDPALLEVGGLREWQVPALQAGPTPAIRGVLPGTPVVIAGHDHQVAAWAAGVREPGQVADSVGTAEAVMTVVDSWPAPADVAAHGMSLVTTVGGRRAVIGGSPSSGAFLVWLADRAGRTVADFLSDLDPAGLPSRSLVMPYPAGRQCPFPDPEATVRVIPDGPVTPASALEALALHASWVIETQLALASQPVGPLMLVGEPLRRNPVWASLKATLHPGGSSLVVDEEPVALGAALVALHRVGHEVAGLASRGVAPLAGLRDAYAELRGDFVRRATSG